MCAARFGSEAMLPQAKPPWRRVRTPGYYYLKSGVLHSTSPVMEVGTKTISLLLVSEVGR
jgi:hypothetical protein